MYCLKNLPKLQIHKGHRLKRGENLDQIKKLGPNKELRPHKYLDQMKTWTK